MKKKCQLKGCRKLSRSKSDYCSRACKVKDKRKESKKVTTHLCLTCDTQIDVKRKYCDFICRHIHTEQKRHSRNIRNFLRSNFAMTIINACRQSGTVECLSGWNFETLQDMRELKYYQFKANGLNSVSGGHIELCHLHPAKTDKAIGLFNPRNLVLYLRTFNRSASNKDYGHIEERILTSQLLDKWKVTKSMNGSDIIQLANEYLRHNLFEDIQQKPFTASKGKSLEAIEPTITHEQLFSIELTRIEKMTRDSTISSYCFSCPEFADKFGVHLSTNQVLENLLTRSLIHCT